MLVYNILYKTLIEVKPLRIRLDKVEGFMGVYDGTRHLVLVCSEKYDFIYNRIIYLIGVKSGIKLLSLIIIQISKLIHTILCP